MCQISKFEYKCNSKKCKTLERTDAEVQVLRYCDWYTNRQLCADFEVTDTEEHVHERQYIVTKTVRNKKCRLCQPRSRLAQQCTWAGLLTLTAISLSWCGRSSANVFNGAWCLATLHILLLTFPVAFRRPHNIEKIQNSIEIFPTPGETCAEYCNELRIRPRTTHVAVDIAGKAIEEVQAGRSRFALVAASIYMASHLVSQPEVAERIMEEMSIDHVAFWKAYWSLLVKAKELVTGELITHGADLSKLPRPC